MKRSKRKGGKSLHPNNVADDKTAHGGEGFHQRGVSSGKDARKRGGKEDRQKASLKEHPSCRERRRESGNRGGRVFVRWVSCTKESGSVAKHEKKRETEVSVKKGDGDGLSERLKQGNEHSQTTAKLKNITDFVQKNKKKGRRQIIKIKGNGGKVRDQMVRMRGGGHKITRSGRRKTPPIAGGGVERGNCEVSSPGGAMQVNKERTRRLRWGGKLKLKKKGKKKRRTLYGNKPQEERSNFKEGQKKEKGLIQGGAQLGAASLSEM